MTRNDGFGRTLSDWLDEQAGRSAPAYLDEVLAQTTHTRQRPWWSSPRGWLPVDIAYPGRAASIPRVLWALGLLAILVLATAVLLIAGVGQRRAPHLGLGTNGHIAFVDGNSIRIAEADGTIGPIVTAVPNGAEQLTFSPDGTRLAYRTLDTSAASIIIADDDGSDPVAVVTGATLVNAEPIAWSPDSRRIAVVVMAGGVETIDVTDADGAPLAQLIPSSGTVPQQAYDPAWSPDGQWISFLSTGADPSIVALNIIHPDGSGQRALTTSPINQEGVAWSPDTGELRLAYIANGQRRCSSQVCSSRQAFVMVYDLAAGTETPLIQTSVVSGFPLTWAPDGRRIAWWDESSSHYLVAEARTGQGATSFPAVPNACQDDPASAGRAICAPARWSPDGQWLYGLDAGGTSIVFIRADGTPSSHAITLGHPATGEGWQAAWQAVTP